MLLDEAGVTASDIDLVLMGKSGIEKVDATMETMAEKHLSSGAIGHFRHFCGDYHTASAFGMWLATRIIQQQRLPETVLLRPVKRKFKNILVYNCNFGLYHSFILLQACRGTT